MVLSEVLALEDANEDSIHLHLEGIFWKAYQRSAYLFVQQVKPFKATKKEVKTVGCDVVSLGFPMLALDKYIVQDRQIHVDEKHVKIAGYLLDKTAYQTWYDGLPQSNRAKPSSAGAMPVAVRRAPVESTNAVDRLLKFRVEASTPMECMMFIVSIQKELNGYL